MSSVWLIRNDTFDDELETLGMVTIGWDMVGDLRAATDPAMVKDQIRAANPDQSAMSLALAAGTLERFARTMAIGDVVVAPRPDRIHLRIGTVTGDYLYVADAPTHRHRRPVAWTHTAIRRADLPDDATSGLRSISTLSQINHGAELFARLAADPRFSPQADNALPDLPTNTWLVGSRIDEADVTDRFIAAGIWQLKDGLDQRAAAIRIGDRIAIKSAYVRYSDLPFDNHRKPVSVMTIKARGVVSGTHDDHLSVDWDSTFTRRDWYFYTFQGAVWRLRDKDEYARALSRFVFEDENQDIEYFLSRSPWNKYSLPQDNSEDQKPTFRIPFPSTEPIYEAADRWREAVLTGTSLFSGRPLDYRAAVRDLTLYFIDSPDEGTDSFFQKLERQLTDAGDDAIALATELLYLYYLPVSTAAVSVSTKHAGVNGVAAWRDSVAPIPEELSTALSAGVARVGTAYQTQRWRLFAYLIRIVDVLTALPSDDRRSALTDWDRFQHTVSAVDDRGVWAIRYLLEHVLFPDHAMAGASRDDREQMLRAFAADDPTVSDANALRHHLEPNIRYGNRFAINLYQPPYRFEWRPLAEHKIIWAAWAMRAVSSPSTVTESLMSTLADASAVMAASSDSIVAALEQLFGHSGQRVLLTFAERDPHTLTELLSHADDWGPGLLIDQIATAISLDPADTAEFLEEMSTLLASTGNDLPIRAAATVQAQERLSRRDPISESATPGEHYLAYVSRIEDLQFAMVDHSDIEVTRLQVSVIADNLVRLETAETDWNSATCNAFDAWRAGKKVAPPDDFDDASPADDTSLTAPTSPVESDHTRISREQLETTLSIHSDAGRVWLDDTLEMLDEKRQMILEGPPGTGKTFIARAIAHHLAGREATALVQFHPGTAYEDFVQGLRPDPSEPGRFAITDGPLIRFAEDAGTRPEVPHVLIIDEINRANLPAVFGELYFLLEYRDEPVTMTYGRQFQLPPNLLIIGTMNTADRSITAVDAALRRRFVFREVRPGEPPLDDILPHWLARYAPTLTWLNDLLLLANQRIRDRDQAIGPSHFLRTDLTEKHARRAWNHTVLPTLTEYFYGQQHRLAELDFDALKSAVTESDADADAD